MNVILAVNFKQKSKEDPVGPYGHLDKILMSIKKTPMLLKVL